MERYGIDQPWVTEDGILWVLFLVPRQPAGTEMDGTDENLNV